MVRLSRQWGGVTAGLLFAAALIVDCRSVLAADALPRPQWIWGRAEEVADWKFTKSFDVDGPILSAGLKFAADGCRATVVVNDVPALTLEPFSPTTEFDVTRWMRRGTNSFQILSTKSSGPAAVALSLAVVEQGDRRSTIVSDGSWSGTSAEAKVVAADRSPVRTLGAVRPELWGIGRRPATTSPFENYEQWKETQSSSARKDRKPKFYAAPGFEIALVRKALPEEGSWISMAFDPQGRLTVSREDRGLLQMTLADDRKSVAKVEPVKLDVDEVRGLLYADGLLYMNANNSHTMFTARPTPEGTFADLRVLRKFPGKVGHGRNDLALAPDGSIYSMHGDAVEQPKQDILDRTSPLRESRKLVAAGKTERREGHLVRLSADRKSWELVCSGLRNPYGVAVHLNGDVFTYDADNEYDMATPWYRPTRIVQLVSGADYGYRDAGGTWPVEVPDHPDVGLPLIDVGRGSPTSAMFGHKLAFPSPYREALYVLDWSYGRVIAVHLEPRGSGYRAALELFLQGQPLNVTDIATGPDGAMYLITGGRKTESALYRVAFTGAKEETERSAAASEAEVHRRASEVFAAEQRKLRRLLETYHGKQDRAAIDIALPHFSSPDPMIRHAARIAIENQDRSMWLPKLLEMVTAAPVVDTATSRVRLTAALAVAATDDKESLSRIVATLLRSDPTMIDLDSKLTVVHLYERYRDLMPDQFRTTRREMAEQLYRVYPGRRTTSASIRDEQGSVFGSHGTTAVLRRRIARLLAECEIGPGTAGADGAEIYVEIIADSLLKSSVQEDRLAGLSALRNRTVGWNAATRRLYFTTLQDASRFVGGQGMPAFIDRLRSEAKATLQDADRQLLGDLIEMPKLADEPLPPPRPPVKKWKVADLAEVYEEKSDRSAELSGDAKRGAEIFRAALCSRCHRSGINGPAVGPDLTVVARRFSRRDILESILVPSLAVAEQYRNAEVTTEDGHVHVGRVVSEGDFRSAKLKLSTDPLRPSRVVELDKGEIAEYRSITTSPMPEGLLDSFTTAEIADLLAFLESGIVE